MEFCKDCIGEPPACYTCDHWMKGNLRDFFAGCALIGCIRHGASPEIIGEAAYNFADAMLKAREAE